MAACRSTVGLNYFADGGGIVVSVVLLFLGYGGFMLARDDSSAKDCKDGGYGYSGFHVYAS